MFFVMAMCREASPPASPLPNPEIQPFSLCCADRRAEIGVPEALTLQITL
jgi:hypothetical protein